MFRLAILQMRVLPGAQSTNLERARSLIEEAAANGAQVCLLPEALTLGWTHGSAQTDADEIPGGKSYEALRDVAAKERVYVCAGLIERAGKQIYNSAVLIDPMGRLILHHRKLNELEIAHHLYAQGDRLAVGRTELGTFGLMICADAFARGQIISRTLGFMGADIILSPSSWAVPFAHDNAQEPHGKLWVDSYCPVAKDFQMWIASASNVGPIIDGPWKGRKCIGCSMVVNPWGQVVVNGPYGEDAEAILWQDIEINPRPARGDGWQTLWAAENQQKH